MIASGPAYPDSSDCGQALHIIKKYDIQISADAEKLLQIETPKALDNVTTIVTGSVKELMQRGSKGMCGAGLSAVRFDDGIMLSGQRGRKLLRLHRQLLQRQA